MSSAEKLGEEGAGEIQFLAQTYNRLYDQNRLANEKLNYEATHDPLTNLYNRAAYASALDGFTTDGTRVALVLVDVDHFKSINDNYGHDRGDAVIKSVADALHESFRDEDMVCRIGGDEFAVIMHDADPGLRSMIIDRLKNVTKKLAHPQDDTPNVTLSAGVAFTDLLAADADLFKSADLALYKVKNGGRNGLAFSYPAGVTELLSFAPDPDQQNKEGTV